MKPEWGVKRTCRSCHARFYDLMKSPIVCPSCHAEYDLFFGQEAEEDLLEETSELEVDTVDLDSLEEEGSDDDPLDDDDSDGIPDVDAFKDDEEES